MAWKIEDWRGREETDMEERDRRAREEVGLEGGGRGRERR